MQHEILALHVMILSGCCDCDSTRRESSAVTFEVCGKHSDSAQQSASYFIWIRPFHVARSLHLANVSIHLAFLSFAGVRHLRDADLHSSGHT